MKINEIPGRSVSVIPAAIVLRVVETARFVGARLTVAIDAETTRLGLVGMNRISQQIAKSLTALSHMVGVSQLNDNNNNIFERLISAQITEKEFVPTGSKIVTNANTAFETMSVRGKERNITFRIQTPEDGVAVSRYHEDFDLEIKFTIEVGEWVDGILVNGDFFPRPPDKPVVISNDSLPSIGERVVI